MSHLYAKAVLLLATITSLLDYAPSKLSYEKNTENDHTLALNKFSGKVREVDSWSAYPLA